MTKGLLSEQEDRQAQEDVENELVSAIKQSEKVPAPMRQSMFTDVYAEMPWHIKEEEEEEMMRHGEADEEEKKTGRKGERP